tara:strand:+ start:69 stop:437 length:369 start_codon:yes stop_codon:yes gene_type:complete
MAYGVFIQGKTVEEPISDELVDRVHVFILKERKWAPLRLDFPEILSEMEISGVQVNPFNVADAYEEKHPVYREEAEANSLGYLPVSEYRLRLPVKEPSREEIIVEDIKKNRRFRRGFLRKFI